MAAYMRWLEEERGLAFRDYAALWRHSVTEIEEFWESIWDYFDLGPRRADTVLSSREMVSARWFAAERVNYAQRVFQHPVGAVALIHRTESGERREMTFGQLADAVARTRAGLQRLGVARGDRVAGFLTNGPEAIIAFLATASLGAIWSSCPPEFGVSSVLDRFSQIEPRVLFATSGYVHGGKRFDRRAAVQALRQQLTSLQACVVVGDASGMPGCMSFEELTCQPAELRIDDLPFEHPLWILFSSGTTGLPKAIVHGHGGMLLEHLKALALHGDLGPESRFFWFTTTGWMMWNYLVGGLLTGATLVLYDGSPAYPDLLALWRLAAEERVTCFGTSAPFLLACRQAELVPRESCELESLQQVGSTGAPLPAEGFEWVYENVGRDLLLGSVSGGTDLCTAFVTSCPLLPVHAGELQCAALGARVEAFDADGKAVVGEVGELVITRPMPCMPIGFWDDLEGSRYRGSYFEHFAGAWRHGDWIEFSPRGSAVITGRSDATLNRGGVRMGTSEFYRVVEELDAIRDSLVVDTSGPDGSGKLWLFVVLADGRRQLDSPVRETVIATLRRALSPRHVPDEIRVIAEVPRTLSGKKLEVPVKRLLAGEPLGEVVQAGTLESDEALRDLAQSAGLHIAEEFTPEA